ncbi:HYPOTHETICAL PROTEIN MCJ_006360 [Mesomycoplasma conjunctivae]|uniref:Uncharacterized protein n=1 Tax=Mesomycoplasma conjunctivae (strain ATCC 25834 / NCTC 10147 / HRC/581) TaxID=572263 RepID=C5J767_MESCH|nr:HYPOTHETICAL PROTEIN MCJ_006360 [Mesomycoplasma conjunctivae]
MLLFYAKTITNLDSQISFGSKNNLINIWSKINFY